MAYRKLANIVKLLSSMYLRAKFATCEQFRYRLCTVVHIAQRFMAAMRRPTGDHLQVAGATIKSLNSEEVGKMNKQQFKQLGNLINEASGYLELGLPKRALACLDRIDNAGPLEGPAQYLRGAALSALERYNEAVVPLQAAALLVPAEAAKQIWLTVSECYRHAGRSDLAIQSLANARGAICPPGPSLPETGEQPDA